MEVSVLVPVLDEAGTVLDLARRVRERDRPLGLPYEIIFVDDGSRDAHLRAGARGARAIDPTSSWSACGATSARRRR